MSADAISLYAERIRRAEAAWFAAANEVEDAKEAVGIALEQRPYPGDPCGVAERARLETALVQAEERLARAKDRERVLGGAMEHACHGPLDRETAGMLAGAMVLLGR